MARTEVVKFVVEVRKRKLWFINTRRYPLHHAFVKRLSLPHDPAIEDLKRFNEREYKSPHRRFEMGSIVHYLDSDLWTFELAACDNLEGARIVRLHETLKQSLWFGKRLKFRPCSPLHEASIAPKSGVHKIRGSSGGTPPTQETLPTSIC